MLIVALTIICLGLFFFVESAQAIVVLPAIILIPLVKLIAVVVAGFSIPVMSGGVILAKVTKNKKITIGFVIISVLIIVFVAAFILRMQNPDNPWF